MFEGTKTSPTRVERCSVQLSSSRRARARLATLRQTGEIPAPAVKPRGGASAPRACGRRRCWWNSNSLSRATRMDED
ncbi:hypothetical protein ElyMa_005100600, partial [Elysia marginata]